MSYVAPEEVVRSMVAVGTAKGRLAAKDLVLRAMLSGGLLGIAATFAYQAQIQVGNAIVGGIVFPVGLVMIVLLGLELATGNFALVPLGFLHGDLRLRQVASNWAWVLLGNLLGCLLYALLFLATTHSGTPVADRLVALAQSKTVAYQNEGLTGMKELFFKGVLCNWMVTMGVVLSMTSTSTMGKIVAMWLPITVFFVQGFEHSVVNMFVIPAGMLFGAHVSVYQWLVWNEIPVTLGNIAGGLLFTGVALYVTHGKLLRHTDEPASAEALESQAEAVGIG